MGDALTRRPATRPVRESFVVHVYRRDGDPGRELTGVVESMVSPHTRAFTGIDELWAALVDVDPALVERKASIDDDAPPV